MGRPDRVWLCNVRPSCETDYDQCLPSLEVISRPGLSCKARTDFSMLYKN